MCWRQKNIQRRLDYLFLNDSLQDDIAKIDIFMAINTENSSIVQLGFEWRLIANS